MNLNLEALRLAPFQKFVRPSPSGSRTFDIRLDPGLDAGARRAAGNLLLDLRKVLGTDEGAVLNGPPGPDFKIRIHQVLPPADKGGPEEDYLQGKRECFLIRVDEQSMDIWGSDRRGLTYGIYCLSEQIGVSPLHWWADVPVPAAEGLILDPGLYTRGEPALEYRGIFLNDEYPCLGNWAKEKFGGFNEKFYEKIFDYLLRCGANFLWPAMWDDCFYDDDPENARLADEMGIVIGTSHHEPMGRAWKEWPRYGRGKWNYDHNRDFIEDYWREGARRARDYETFMTLGMRGDGDEPLEDPEYPEKVRQIIHRQREILAEVHSRPAGDIPQVWAIYKEVQEAYAEGREVPEDILILLSDDNWGSLRHLPGRQELERSGGFGLYYHFDYVGGPRNYKWLNSTSLDRCQEQMSRAWAAGIRRMWIVNVGDFKLQEFPTEFFLRLAWEVAEPGQDWVRYYAREWARSVLGAVDIDIAADILLEYGALNAARKPELLDPETLSWTHYREAERVLAKWEALEARALKLAQTIHKDYEASAFQLLLFPVLASTNLYRLHTSAGRARFFSRQGRAGTVYWAGMVQKYFAIDAELAQEYHDLLDGKWTHFASQTHISYSSWQQPERDRVPKVELPKISRKPQPAVWIEGSDQVLSLVGGETQVKDPLLIDALAPQLAYLEVFNQGQGGLKVDARIRSLEPEALKVKLDPLPGPDGAVRIQLDPDWSLVAQGEQRGELEIILGVGAREWRLILPLRLLNPPRVQDGAWLASGGILSIPGEGYEAAGAEGNLYWLLLGPIGRAPRAPALMEKAWEPGEGRVQSPQGNKAWLEYRLSGLEAGPARLVLDFAPLNDIHPERRLDLAVELGGMRQELNLFDRLGDWNQMTARHCLRIELEFENLSGREKLLRLEFSHSGPVLQGLVLAQVKIPPVYFRPPDSLSNPPAQVEGPEGGENKPKDPQKHEKIGS